MQEAKSGSNAQLEIMRGTRIASIDIFRALTMVLMIFVNDLWSLKDIPNWLNHVSWDTDGMGLADVIFPAFLFIVGMSIPAAISSRRKKGDSNKKIVFHILTRSMALLLMGIFLVNGESIHEAATGMKRVVWNSLSCISFILIYNFYPFRNITSKILRGTGLVMLVTLAVLYRGGEADDLKFFSTHWWGILGLIGWAYLTSALIYTFCRDNFYVLTGVWVLFLVGSAFSQTEIFEGTFLPAIIGPLGGGALPALVTGGVLVSMIFRYYQMKQAYWSMTFVLCGLSIALLILGVYARSFWGISKLRATPAWVLLCSGITVFMFILVYWLCDRKGKANLFNFIKPAGTDTLLCYLLPYFCYTVIVLLNVQWPDIMLTGISGLAKSLTFGFLCVILTDWLCKAGIKLKL